MLSWVGQDGENHLGRGVDVNGLGDHLRVRWVGHAAGFWQTVVSASVRRGLGTVPRRHVGRHERGRLIATTPARSRSSSPARPPSQGLPFVPAAGFVLVWSSGYIAGPYGSPPCRRSRSSRAGSCSPPSLPGPGAGAPTAPCGSRATTPSGSASRVHAQRRPVRRDVPRLRRRAGGHPRLTDALAQPCAHRRSRRGLPARAAGLRQMLGFVVGVVGVMLVLGPDIEGAGGARASFGG